METQAESYSQRHLITVAEVASAVAKAKGITGIDALRVLTRHAEGRDLNALLYPPHQPWQHGGNVNRIGAPAENQAGIWRALAVHAAKKHQSDKDAFSYPPAASTWHMLAADVYEFGMCPALSKRVSVALRELATRYSPELGDDEAELLKPATDAAEPEVPPAPQPVPVVQTEAAHVVELPRPSAGPIETPEERRARWLDMFEEKGGADKRGALAELSRELNVDRSNLKKDLNKAEEHREEKRREGAFGVATSQLVRNGKRRT